MVKQTVVSVINKLTNIISLKGISETHDVKDLALDELEGLDGKDVRRVAIETEFKQIIVQINDKMDSY